MPFLVLKVKKNEKKYENKVGSIIQFEEIHFAIQEFMFNIDTLMLINICKLFFKTATLFDLGKFVSEGKMINEVCPQVNAKDGVFIDE